MIFRLAFLLALFAALPARAQQFEFDADRTETTATESIATGHARFAQPGFVLTADELRLANDRSIVTARGHVIATRGATRLLADTLVYQIKDGSYTAQRVRLGAYPYYVEGESANGTASEITVSRATLTYGEPGAWQPTLRADKIIYAPGQRIRTENSAAGIGHLQFLPFPKLTQDLHEPFAGHVSLTGGFRRSLGAFVDASVHLPTPAPGVFLGADVALYTSRGVMFGPAGSYARGDELHGFFRSGYINDHGDKKLDLLGRPVPEERAYAEWQHSQQLSENVSLTAQLNWWKDSEVVRDFRPRAFFPVQEPDTFAESAYTGKNYFVSLFARFQPNSFNAVQQRLPEVRFDLLPTAVGGGFVERFNASAAVLHESALPASPVIPIPIATRRSNRLDAYYALERPFAAGDYFSFTPIVGGRVTHYSGARTTVADFTTNPALFLPAAVTPPTGITTLPVSVSLPLSNYTRTLGEVGFDAALRTSGAFNYKNAQWGIDGLRHLFTPRVSYRYIPEGNRGRGRIAMIDRNAFSTYLQPLGLGDARNLDDLHATNTLRFGLDNTIQTRDATYGSRDLFTLNLATDFRFKRAAGERLQTDVHGEFGFTPARWLQVDTYSRLTPQAGTLQEFNSGVTLHDGDAWSVRLANNFLRRDIEDYQLESRLRLNERYDALTRLHYDARKRRFNEQAYGLVQNLDNTWRISYVVSLYSGPRRESHFGLNVQIDAIGF